MTVKEKKYLISLFKNKSFVPLWFVGIMGAISEFLLAYKLNILMNYLSEKQVDQFWKSAIYLIGLSLVIGICKLFTVSQQGRLKQKIEFDLSNDLIKNVFVKKTISVEKMGKGGWITILNSDVPLLSGVVPETFTNLLIGLSSFLSAIVFGFLSSWMLTCFILILSLFSMAIPRLTGKLITVTQENTQHSREDMQEIMLQVFGGRSLLRSFFAERFGLNLFKEKYQRYTRDQLINAKSQWRMNSISLAAGFIFDVTPLVFSIYLISVHALTLGQFMGFNVLNANFTWAFYQLPGLYANWARQKASLKRVVKFLASDQIKPIDNNNLHSVNSFGLQRVSFRYPKNEDWVLKDASIFINLKNRQKILLVGESGAGKTTVIKLLMGLYEPNSGKISGIGIDENIEQKVNPISLVSYVPQETEIFSDTVRNNLLLGRKVPEAELSTVIQKVGLRSLIDGLPNKLETQIFGGDNMNLSAGQLQKIGLARALLAKRPLIVLDEPTANLDQTSEKDFLRVLSQLPMGIFMISHRDSVETDWLTKKVLKNKKIVDAI
ncbi:ABC transporter ATP-binding protein [Pediococcus parvulus]|uniref:ABC transporter ATP-binding protein n=1 Tax=Pediococcus parvulus TaxID=54062 RepID=UPI00070BDBBA|nr:ABC transporter ATP-binding protein [Pediococcus parvulus]MCT3026495.1 ATP-binding cassette domain-containing protein [Pediococcus parvulus]GEL90219.1 ABC transporter [Pediococcus parvulus]GHC14149.1 ABC transporter [Pediococcus parvulus]